MFFKDYDNTRRRIPVDLYLSSDGVSPATAAAAGQPQLSKNGAAPANTAATLTAVDAAKGKYYLELSAAELDTLGFGRLIFDDANTVPFDVTVAVEPHPYLDDGTAQAGAASTITLRAGASAVDDAYTDALAWIYDGPGAGQIRGVAGYVGASKVATVDRPWRVQPTIASKYLILPAPQPMPVKETFDVLTSSAFAAGSVGEVLVPLRRFVAAAGAAGTITLDAGASAVNDFYKGHRIRIIAGQGAGQGGIISAYDGTTKIATVNGAAFNPLPNNTSVCLIESLGAIPGATAPTAAQNAQAVADLALASVTTAGSLGKLIKDFLDVAVSSRSSFNAGTDLVGVGAVSAGAITAGAIAADAIGASELAADAVTEIRDAIMNADVDSFLASGSVGEALALARPFFDISADGLTVTWRKRSGLTLLSITAARAVFNALKTMTPP